jgi:hypothetical protein
MRIHRQAQTLPMRLLRIHPILRASARFRAACHRLRTSIDPFLQTIHRH